MYSEEIFGFISTYHSQNVIIYAPFINSQVTLVIEVSRCNGMVIDLTNWLLLLLLESMSFYHVDVRLLLILYPTLVYANM